MKRIALLAACALVAACSAAPALTHATAPSASPGHLMIGAADTSYTAFRNSTGVSPALVESYVHPFRPLPLAAAGPAEPLVQIEPRHAPLSAVAAGKYDGWLHGLAVQAKAYGKPLLLGWAPEMNGAWYSWGYKSVTPAQYVKAWRHVVSVFRKAGAVNVTFLWTVNVTTPGVSAPASWWPGAKFVGTAGIDGYIDTASQTYANKIAPTVAAVRKFWHGPVILSETAASPAAGKAAKIADLFAGAAADHLAALVWFDLNGNKDWPIDGDPAALAAFRAAVRRYGR